MTEYKTEILEHLGIVESIDNAIEQDKNERKVTIGEAVKAMILNGLGFVNQQLYLPCHCYFCSKNYFEQNHNS